MERESTAGSDALRSAPCPAAGPLIPPYNGKLPRIHRSAWISPTATIIGDVQIHVDEGFPCILDDNVTVGHQTLVHGARVSDGTLIGISASLLSGVSVGAGSLAAGVPASVRRQFRAEEQAELIQHAGQYVVTAQSQVSVSEAVTLTNVQLG